MPQNSKIAQHINGFNRKANMLFVYSLEAILLSIIYKYYVSDATAYMGFENSKNIYKIAFSLLIFILIFSLTPQCASVRSFFLNILLSIYIIPCLIIYSLSDKPTFALIIIIYSLSIVYISSNMNLPMIKFTNISYRSVMYLSLIASTTIVFMIFRFDGFGNFNLNIYKVYEFRSESESLLPDAFSYLRPLISLSIIPIGIVSSIIIRNRIYSIIFLIISVILFGFSNHKGILFYPLLSVSIYLVMTKDIGYSSIISSLNTILIISCIDMILYLSSNDPTVSGLIVDIVVRRGLFVPPLLDYDHIVFYSENPKYYWSMSKITFGLISSPYDIPAPYIIGRAFFNSNTMAANTGFIGNGYAQAGIFGVTIYSIFVGCILSYLNTLGRKLGVPFVVAIMFSQVVTMFTGADFLTMMLTHGMLVSLFLLSIMKAPDKIGAQNQGTPKAREVAPA